MAGSGPGPLDPREGRRPKDSEFYQIPPDLKKEFDMIMAERAEGGGPAVEKIDHILRTRRKLATLSLVFGVLGGALIGAGPLAAIVLGSMARRAGRDVEGVPSAGLEAAKFGMILGGVMLVVNIVTLVVLLGR